MKEKLLTVVLSVMLFPLHFGAAQNTSPTNWTTKNPFNQKVFIENKGQYQLPGKAEAKDILFYSHQNGLQYYFTPTGILISRIVSIKRSEKEMEQLKQKNAGKKMEDDDDDEVAFKKIEQFHEMNFEGANSNDTITGDNKVSWYYNYNIKGNLPVKAQAWKKLIYHNLYPGIDVEFYFPENKDGFEYSFIVHPGAAVSQIKIKYNGNVKLTADGNLTVTSPFGNFTEYTPVTRLLSSNKEINCGFSLNNGRVTFTADVYDKNETLLIDPLIIPPTFNGTNDAYDLDWDDVGNIYVYGGSYPWQIMKYNSAGALLWSYTTIFNGFNQYIGDFAVDKHSQSVYVVEGRDVSPSALAFKLNSAGTYVAQYSGNVDFNEMWKIAFSSCTNQAVIAGGGSTTPSYTASYLDTNLVNLQLVNTLDDNVSGYHDMWDLALDNFGNSYMVTAHSLYSTIDPNSFDNVLLKLPLPTLTPTIWMVQSNYDVLEHASLTYGLNNTFPPSPGNGYNGMTVSNTTLYTYDSYVLKQWATSTGNILDSIFVNGPSKDSTISWGGLTSDDCGNIFLGSINTVQQYNSNLNLVQTFAEPDTVYDVRLSNTDMLYACGINFISSMQVSLATCHIINVTNSIKNVDCDSLGSATVTPTGGTPPYIVTWNTAPVQTGNTATGLYAGTYVATITDSSCEKQTYFDTINISTNAIKLSPNNATICQGDSATLSAAGGVSTYSWSPPTGLSSTNDSIVVANPTITTTYTVIGTSAEGCSDTVQSVVTVNPAPVILVTNSPAICIGNSTTLTASGATDYVWLPSAGLSGTTGSSVTANPTTTTTYTITGTGNLGCIGTKTVTVTVNPNPTITVSTPSPICSSSGTILTASGATTYTWTPGIGLSATTGASVTANPTTTTTYTINGMDSTGCVGTTTVTVIVNPNPTITVATPAPICSGSGTTLTAFGATTYTWTPATGLNTTSGSSVTANPIITTTYTITGADSNGCIGTTSVIVTVNPNLTITVETPSPICIGSSAALTASGATTYTWSPLTGLSSSTGSSIIANPTTTTAYTITGTGNNGCAGTTTVTVIVNPNSSIIVSTPAPICSGNTAALTASGATTYTWTPATGLSTTTGSSITANPTTTTAYTVTGTDNNGCVGATTVTVIVNPNPTITVETPAPMCSGDSTTLIASGAISYTWSPSAGLSSSIGSSITANPSTTTTYTITGTDINGCTNTTTAIVTVNPNLIITIATPAPICNGGSTTLTAHGAATYVWLPAIGLNNTTGSSVIATPTITSTYTITGTSGVGCSSTNTVTVTVNPNPTIMVVSPAPICSGNSAALTVSGAVTYSWSPSTGLSAITGSSVTANPSTTMPYTIMGTDTNGCTGTTAVTVNVNPNPTITITTPSPICSGNITTLTASGAITYTWTPTTGLSAVTGSSVTANPSATTSYTITGTDINGCTGTTTVTVNVNPNPTITVTTPSPICSGSSTSLTASGTITYTWTPAIGLSAVTGSSITANPSTTTSYIITGTDVNGCTGTTTVTVNINPNPTITIVTPAPICSGSSTVLTASGATTYSWAPIVGLNTTTGSSVTASPTITTTYTITGTDNNGCAGTTIVPVTINPNPTIRITTPLPICSGSSTTLTASGAATYTWTPATGLNATTGLSVTATPSVNTTYTVTGTDNTGCTGTTSVPVTVNPNPSITVTTPLPICSCNSVALTASGASTYIWNPSTGLNTTTGSSLTANPTITTTYTITGTDNNGCTGTAPVTVIINPIPTITVVAPTPICVGNNVTLTASGAATYAWSPAAGLNDTTGSSVISNTLITTTYTLTGTSDSGCSTTTTITVTVNPNPTITVSTPAPMCSGNSVALIAGGATTYTWTPVMGLSATTGSSVTANPTATLTYTITGVDNNGCTATTMVPVIINPNPTITVATPSPICYGNSTTLTANGASTYYWTPSIGLNNSTGSSLLSNPTITTTYTITGIDSNACTAVTTVVVTVNPNPIITVSAPSPTCSGNVDTLTANGALTYLWTPSVGLSDTTGSVVTAKPAVTTTYTIIGTDGNGCNSSTKINVRIYPVPKIIVSSPPSFCVGDSTMLNVQGATSYSWSPSVGLSATSGTSVLAKPITTVTYTVTGTDINGCIGTSEVLVIVNANPTVSATAPSPICKGNTAMLTASGAFSYSWSPSSGLNETSGSSVIANPTTSTTYTVIGINEAGCSSQAKVQVSVMPLPIVSVFGLNPAYCINASPVTLIGNPNGGIFSGNGVDSNQFNPALAGGVGIYLIKYVYTDSGGCKDSSIISITVDPLPKVIISPNNPTICSGIPVTLNVMGAGNYVWRPGAGLADSTANSITVDPTITTTYIVTGTNADSCFDTAMVTVNVDSMPLASFNTQISNYCDPQTIVFNNRSDDGSNYNWDFGDGTTSNEFNTQHTYKQGGTYQVRLVVTSPHGCIDDTVKDVVIEGSDNDFVKIGDAFTPTSEDINSVIVPHVLCSDLSSYVFRVYNRWGQLLFQTYDPNAGWDGKFNGQMQLVGVYDYYIELNCSDCKIFKKGNITLLK